MHVICKKALTCARRPRTLRTVTIQACGVYWVLSGGGFSQRVRPLGYVYRSSPLFTLTRRHPTAGRFRLGTPFNQILGAEDEAPGGEVFESTGLGPPRP